MLYDIPINFTVEAKTEYDAEETIHKLLNTTIKKYGLEELIEFQDFEFVAKDASSC